MHHTTYTLYKVNISLSLITGENCQQDWLKQNKQQKQLILKSVVWKKQRTGSKENLTILLSRSNV